MAVASLTIANAKAELTLMQKDMAQMIGRQEAGMAILWAHDGSSGHDIAQEAMRAFKIIACSSNVTGPTRKLVPEHRRILLAVFATNRRKSLRLDRLSLDIYATLLLPIAACVKRRLVCVKHRLDLFADRRSNRLYLTGFLRSNRDRKMVLGHVVLLDQIKLHLRPAEELGPTAL